MTDPNRAHLLLVIDRSGSMQMLAHEADKGIKSFLQEQAELDLEITVSLAQFDHQFEWVLGPESIDTIPPYFMQPRGMTALLDAVGRAVTEEDERLAKLAEEERPGKVVCVIVTDGQENASKEWKLNQVKELIEKQKNEFSWEFVFLASDLGAFQMGQDLGARATKFHATAAGTRSVYGATGQTVSNYLSGATAHVENPDEV